MKIYCSESKGYVTRKQVFEALTRYASLDYDESTGHFVYYLHFVPEDGRFVPRYSAYTVEFTCPVDYSEIDSMDTDDIYNKETWEDPEFMEVVDNLTRQVNDYIKKGR